MSINNNSPMKKLIEKNIRVSLKAEEQIISYRNKSELIDQLLDLKKEYISFDDVLSAISKMNDPSSNKNEENKKSNSELKSDLGIKVKRQSKFKPIAKEYSSDIKVLGKDITGKSRTVGGIGDFIDYFRSRYKKLSHMLKKIDPKYPELNLVNIKNSVGERSKIIVMIMSKRETKKKNILLEVEDLTGTFKVVIGQSNVKLFELAQKILTDEVISIRGKVLEAFMIAEDIEWPNLPVTRERKYSENDLAIAYLSDIHFGSNTFMADVFDRFISWINGESSPESLASKLKYILIAGDIVDGVGIYPNQEKELLITDVYKQYKLFDDFVSRVPDYIDVIIIPGNHDAVRRGEPSPAIGKDLISSDVISLGNPSTVEIEGLKHVLYHGTSLDSMISNLSYLSYKKPEKGMEEFLMRRHLSPIYGGNLIIPEKEDYLVLEDEPDVLHVGHIHKNGYGYYRGTVLINSGTFQSQTEFQIKQGHVPTPGMVPVCELKSGHLKTLNFNSD